MATIKFNRLHGDSSWKQALEKEEWDRAIFYGNYLDGSHHTNEELAQNLSDIIDTARRDSRMILLLGEHDRQYVGGPRVPGYREDGHELFEKVLMSGHDVFLRSLLSEILDDDSQMSEGFYYLDDEPRPLRAEPRVSQRKPENKKYEYETINGKKVGIYSSYGSNIDQSVIDAQAKVFEAFGRKVNQIKWEGRHPAFLDYIVQTEEVDFFMFFDIDAIPLRADFLEEMICRAEGGLVGAEQISVHISDHVFAASFAFCISRESYEKLGRPSFEITPRSDCAQEITHIAQEMGVKVDLIKFSKCIKEHYYWKLLDGRKYGYGSFYEDLIFHNFEARHSLFLDFFLDKCDEITKTFRTFPV